ncbi:MAG: class I SAM-dependent methyltransferase [Betaproteobacteria bacterium]
MNATALHEGIKAAYEDVAYVGRPNHHSHVDRIAAIATLFGLSPPDPARARILEVGCGDAANLLPMAARFPGARFVGCDYSALLMGQARAMAADLRLSNVEFVEGDLRDVAASLGTFDYVIGHGFYSWVPTDVRNAFVAMLGRQLAPGGLGFVSYNALPGCFIRRIGWDALRLAVAGIPSARDRLAASRRELRDLADAWSSMPGVPGHLGREYGAAADRSDSALYHDDLSAMNHAVYFSSFVQEIGRQGLGFLAEAELGTMSMAGLPERMRALVAEADPLAREQMLDFARVRRFRQSIVARTADVQRAGLVPSAVTRLHLSAVTGVVQKRSSGAERSVEGPLIDLLVDAYPASVPGAEAIEHLQRRGWTSDDARTTVVRGCFSGAVDLHASPLPLVTRASARPRIPALARWQAARGDSVTSIRHAPVRVDEANARALVIACDGTRDREALVRAAAMTASDAGEVVDHYLERFASAGLFEA